MSSTSRANIVSFLSGGFSAICARVVDQTAPFNSTICNGVNRLMVPLVSGQWTRARLATLDANGDFHNVSLVCTDGSTSCCEAHQLAQDSMMLWRVPAPAQSFWTLTSVGRIDLAVSCTSDASLVWFGGSIHLSVNDTLAAKYVWT